MLLLVPAPGLWLSRLTFFKKKNLVIYFSFWLCWVFIAVWAFFLVVAGRGFSLLLVCGLFIVVASPDSEHRLQGARASAAAACGLSNCGSRVLEHRLNSRGAQT